MSNSKRRSMGKVATFIRHSDKANDDFFYKRGEKILEKLIKLYPENEDRLKKAHERLKNDPNYTQSMHNVALSLTEKCIKVFVSYRKESDADVAKTIANVFRDLSKERVIVTIADEFTKEIPGLIFKSEIESAIKNSHWFIFIISEVHEPSSWCMFETGMFRAKMISNRMERLVCLCHPDAKLPDAISEYQSVKADVPHLQHFLAGLFRDLEPLPGWDKLNPDLSDNELQAAAERIKHAFRSPLRPVSLNYNVMLKVKNRKELESLSSLSKIEIETDEKTADLFGKVEKPVLWGELISNVLQKNIKSRWLEELLAVLKKASEGNVFRPISATFECSNSGRVMRPVLHSMEHDGSGTQYKFNLYFLEEIHSAPVHNIPSHTMALLIALRMNNRIRWEIIQRFSNISWTNHDIDACAKAFSRIEREGEMFGQLDVNQLSSNYGENVRDEVKSIVQKWEKLKNPGHGKFDLAFKYYDVDKLNEAMNESKVLTNQFFQLTFPILEDVMEC